MVRDHAIPSRGGEHYSQARAFVTSQRTVIERRRRRGASSRLWHCETRTLGDPVVGATVRLLGATGPVASATSGADGSFVLSGVPEGSYAIEAEHVDAGSSRGRNTVRVRGGERLDDFDVRLPLRVRAGAGTRASTTTRTGVAVDVRATSAGVAVSWVAPESTAERHHNPAHSHDGMLWRLERANANTSPHGHRCPAPHDHRCMRAAPTGRVDHYSSEAGISRWQHEQ